MPKIPFKNLEIKQQKRFKNKGFKMKDNCGIDTETYQGFVKLICDDSGRYKFIDDFEGIVSFLTHSRFKEKFNWFYNIRFDFESIIKYLDYNELLTLYQDMQIVRDGITISYIDKKFFSIKNKHNEYYYFYDLYNFLDTSLNNAAKTFLNDEKLSIVDSSQLNTNLDYWNENENIIIDYCIKDAKLTKRLADYFWRLVYKNMNFVPKRPFSKGKISEEYFLSKCFIPTINNIDKKVLEIAYNSYTGGRFELVKKGHFDKVYTYDIKSAYPAQIAELIDYSKGLWEKTDIYHEDAYTGYYLCDINCLETDISPFTKKVNLLNVYPNGHFKQFLPKWEYDLIKEHFPNSDIKTIYGYEFWEKELLYPFKEEINRLYQWKETEKDESVKYAVKIFMNALYGKFIQVTNYNTGKLFNPIYASEITSKTRVTLIKKALEAKDNLISMSTDSIASEKKLSVPLHPSLGDFDKDFEGKGVYVISDVYCLENEQAKKIKSKLRGFSVALTKDSGGTAKKGQTIKLSDILNKMINETIYEYETVRVYHLGECLTHSKTLDVSKINIFDKVKKSIDINSDEKRIWDRQFKSGVDAMNNIIESKPLYLEGD